AAAALVLAALACQPLAAPARAAPEPAPTVASAPWAAASARVDALVRARLDALGIAPAPRCSDETFVRRVHLDVIGTLPRLDEVRAFLRNRKPDRRAALVDALLEREEFADYLAMRWCTLLRVKSEFPINLWPNAVQAYHRWIRTQVRENVPWDRFARALLTSSGSNVRVPAVNFHRAVQRKDAPTLARAVALTFLGCRAETWDPARLDGLAACLARVGWKTTAEWKEEIVFFDVTKPGVASTTLPDGTVVKLPPRQDPREVLADWVVSPSNPWFAKAIANRVWSWLLGTGIVHEPDDLRPDNPPTNPELLALLEREVVAAGFDLKHLFRVILNSETYQRACVPTTDHPGAEAAFAHYAVRRLEAEVLIDAINQVTGTTEEYTSKIPEPFTFMPEGQRSIALADASVTSPFLELFGRSPRVTGLESEQRAALPTVAQRLHLLNSTHLRRKLEQGPNMAAMLKPTAWPRDTYDTLYLTILSRYPTAAELEAVRAHQDDVGSLARAGVDLAWALINGAEFQCRH
ncbi:MAG: DUF1553 domain-containing protein, partial [Planctomycetia bacterium]|nr:DUF1553 domain-containing protein [Planctomycetia bacterium]